MFDYGFYSDCLYECYKKFGDIKDIPIIYSLGNIFKENYNSGNILDIGAGKSKPMEKIFMDKLKDGKYYSLDNDPQGNFDFNDFNEIPPSINFKLITANQIFEHLDIKESFEFIDNIRSKLETDGKIIATVPNMAHPVRYFGNITHKTPWEFHSFYMLFKKANLKVIKIFRYSKYYPSGRFEKFLANKINKIYRIDWCDSIGYLAQNQK